MTAKGIAIFSAAALGAVMLASSAQAAVTVLGPGPAENCFKVAEYGGNAKDGIAVCTQALEGALSRSDRAATYVNRGVLKLDLNDNDAAIADINQGLIVDPKLADGYVDRGAVSIALKRYDDALADLNRGIELGAHRPQIAYYDRAIVYEAMGNIRAAYEDYKKAVELQPDFEAAMRELKRFKVTRKSDGI
jgi:tetratricopeptide (TPR) repeat protein